MGAYKLNINFRLRFLCRFSCHQRALASGFAISEVPWTSYNAHNSETSCIHAEIASSLTGFTITTQCLDLPSITGDTSP